MEDVEDMEISIWKISSIWNGCPTSNDLPYPISIEERGDVPNPGKST